MSTPLLGSALPRRVISLLMAALFGLTLALIPMSAPKADAAVPAVVGSRALHVAIAQVGIPYRYGGASPRTGFDCSGLTMYSYARVGRRIPRVAQDQYRATIRIARRAARPGDLIFFYRGRNRYGMALVYHVGIYAGNGYYYNAPYTGTRVRRAVIRSTNYFFGRVR